MKNELYNVLSGKSQVRFGATIQAITGYLADGTKPSKEIKNTKHFKKQETERLIHYIESQKYWFQDVDYSQYISEGAEQRVYLKNSQYVLKLNDSIYYLSWLDYFHNLLLHNYFFPDTAYELLGFTNQKDVLYAVLKQAYVQITQQTDLNRVKEFMAANGFINTRNNDYYNDELGIILEDLHDENVLTKNDVLYFVDTVFYLTDDFWML
ncbi:hypothetical protein FJ651_02865 [Paucihalobacter ruber]|uniref:Uncharacterized protein n=1 Tax=Paucihalobacter ruber TaxID=2567861 RepID=A0A506PRQ4_9FLAO|nr:hypothetical protein [Paucihalobacter ruber]TPV35875.1 hypothetical protein FJ651_02865 [Paucihalobacter ruber]